LGGSAVGGRTQKLVQTKLDQDDYHATLDQLIQTPDYVEIHPITG